MYYYEWPLSTVPLNIAGEGNPTRTVPESICKMLPFLRPRLEFNTFLYPPSTGRGRGRGLDGIGRETSVFRWIMVRQFGWCFRSGRTGNLVEGRRRQVQVINSLETNIRTMTSITRDTHRPSPSSHILSSFSFQRKEEHGIPGQKLSLQSHWSSFIPAIIILLWAGWDQLKLYSYKSTLEMFKGILSPSQHFHYIHELPLLKSLSVCRDWSLSRKWKVWNTGDVKFNLI